MSKEELLKKLKALEEEIASDPEASHCLADSLLLEYIGDPEITQAYRKVDRWYPPE